MDEYAAEHFCCNFACSRYPDLSVLHAIATVSITALVYTRVMARRGPDYCRVVVITSLAWLFAMSIFMVYLLDTGPKQTINQNRHNHKSSRHEQHYHQDEPAKLPDLPDIPDGDIPDRDPPNDNVNYNDNNINNDINKDDSVGKEDVRFVDKADLQHLKHYDEENQYYTKAQRQEKMRVRALENRKKRLQKKRMSEGVDPDDLDKDEPLTDKYEVHNAEDDVETHGILARLMRGLNLDEGGPGEMGHAVHIPPEKDAEQKELFKLNQFNLMASDMISLNRSLPDYRSAECQNKAYPAGMDSVSIIIVFHNEAWSTLLRTLHSVVNRSPKELLHEIILIDDLSNRDYLRKPLAEYIKRFHVKMTLVHMPERSGLIRARLKGAGLATGKIMLFLDAHVEVSKGWLPPLVARVHEAKNRVVAPIIDVISDETFEYVTASDMTWGGFNWHLNFRWYPVPQRENNRRGHDRSEAIQTPTIAGGLFAIDRDYFYEIGTYDEGMQVWGGENLEISFRVWTCGGSLEIVPCSRVGHVFRKQTPYTFPGGTATVIHRNSARTAEVWMDEYKQFFYEMVPGAKTVDVGDLTERRELRKRMGCKNFKWYLDTVYKESPIPSAYYSIGAISNPKSGTGSAELCLDTMGHKEGQAVGVSGCHGQGGNQAWSLTGAQELRADEICLVSDGRTILLSKCTGRPDQRWQYQAQTHHLQHVSSGLCITRETRGDNHAITVKQCHSSQFNEQYWKIHNYRADFNKSARKK